MMKIKKGFILSKVGKEYMAVAVGNAKKEFQGIIRLNSEAGYLWDELKNGISEDELVRKMLARYDDLDAETASKDLKEFLEIIKVALEEV